MPAMRTSGKPKPSPTPRPTFTALASKSEVVFSAAAGVLLDGGVEAVVVTTDVGPVMLELGEELGEAAKVEELATPSVRLK